MRPVSANFARVVRGSHRMAARARLLSTYQEGVDPVGVEIPIISGDVVADSTADIRATVDLSTDGRGWSTDPDTLRTPYGTDLFVERGIVFGNGDIEYVSQGYFRLYAVEQDNAPDGTLRMAAKDRMSGIIDARLERPIEFAIGTSVGDTVDFLVHGVYPNATIEYDFDPYAEAFARSYVAEEDRYGFLADIVTSLGKVWYWDYRGVLRIESAPDPRDPLATIDAGENGVLVSLSRSLSREGVYNAVVATGESPGDIPTYQAIARNENPESATYYYGTFGKVPRFYFSPFVTNLEQAKSAAVAILKQSLGLPYNVDLSAVPNPALEVLDPVTVEYANGAETHTLERITTPLSPGGVMSATTREQTRVEIGVET